MKYHAFNLALLFAFGVAVGTASAQEKIKPQLISGQIEWLYDYAAGQELAGQTGKPLLVVFRCER